MRIIIILFFLVIQSCVQSSKKNERPLKEIAKKDSENYEKVIEDENLQSIHPIFRDIESVNIPDSITQNNRDWFFPRKKEIKIPLAFEILLSYDSSKLIQPQSSGGYYQFFDLLHVKGISDNLKYLFYKRYSYECYSGLVLASFTQDFKPIDEILIAADSIKWGESTGQKEFYYIGNGEFQVKELVINMDDDEFVSKDKYIGTITTLRYKCDSTGHFIKLNKNVEKQCLVVPESIVDDFRIKVCEEG